MANLENGKKLKAISFGRTCDFEYWVDNTSERCTIITINKLEDRVIVTYTLDEYE